MKQIYTKSALNVVFLVVLSLLKTPRKRALNGMIDKVEFTAKNLTSNAGVLLLLNYTEEQRIFQELELPRQCQLFGGSFFW